MTNRTITIRNKRTGELRTIPIKEVGKYNISLPDNQAQAHTQATPQSLQGEDLGKLGKYIRGTADLAKKFGLGAIPTIQGAMFEVGREGLKGLGRYIPQVGEYVQDSGLATRPNPFLSEQEMRTISQKPIESVARQTAGLASWAVPGPSATRGVRALTLRGGITGATRGALHSASQPGTNPKDMIKEATLLAALTIPTDLARVGYFTKKGVSKLTEEATSKATTAGKGIHWDELSKQIRNEVTKKLGETRSVTRALDDILMEKVPAGIESKLTAISSVDNPLAVLPKSMIKKSMIKNPEQLLEWRRQILAREGSNILQSITKGTNIDDKVASIARNVISKNLHKLAPGTVVPDRLYTIYSKGGKAASKAASNLLTYAIPSSLFYLLMRKLK